MENKSESDKSGMEKKKKRQKNPLANHLDVMKNQSNKMGGGIELVRQFNSELSSIYENKLPVSKAKMASITRLAVRGLKHYKHIVHSVEKFMQKCKPEYKIAALYVLDSIIRQSRHQFGADKDLFGPRFQKNIKFLFQNIFQCPHEDKPKVVRVLNLWQKNGIFTPEVIQPLIDMASTSTKILQAAMQRHKKARSAHTKSMTEDTSHHFDNTFDPAEDDDEGEAAQGGNEPPSAGGVQMSQEDEIKVLKAQLDQQKKNQELLQQQLQMQVIATRQQNLQLQLQAQLPANPLAAFAAANPALGVLGGIPGQPQLPPQLNPLLTQALGATQNNPQVNLMSHIQELTAQLEKDKAALAQLTTAEEKGEDAPPQDQQSTTTFLENFQQLLQNAKGFMQKDPRHEGEGGPLLKDQEAIGMEKEERFGERSQREEGRRNPDRVEGFRGGRGGFPGGESPSPAKKPLLDFNAEQQRQREMQDGQELYQPEGLDQETFPPPPLPQQQMEKFPQQPPPQHGFQDDDMQIDNEDEEIRPVEPATRSRWQPVPISEASHSQPEPRESSRNFRDDGERSRDDRRDDRESRRDRDKGRDRSDRSRDERSSRRDDRDREGRDRDREGRDRDREGRNRDRSRDKDRESRRGDRYSSRDPRDERQGRSEKVEPAKPEEPVMRKEEELKQKDKESMPPAVNDRITVASVTVWVGRLPRNRTNPANIEEAFSTYGEIKSVDLIDARGCAFVTMKSRYEADRALRHLKHKRIEGNEVRMAWGQAKGMQAFSKYWDESFGCAYIPTNMIKEEDLLSLMEGSIIDESTLPPELTLPEVTETKDEEEPVTAPLEGIPADQPAPAVPAPPAASFIPQVVPPIIPPHAAGIIPPFQGAFPPLHQMLSMNFRAPNMLQIPLRTTGLPQTQQPAAMPPVSMPPVHNMPDNRGEPRDPRGMRNFQQNAPIEPPGPPPRPPPGGFGGPPGPPMFDQRAGNRPPFFNRPPNHDFVNRMPNQFERPPGGSQFQHFHRMMLEESRMMFNNNNNAPRMNAGMPPRFDMRQNERPPMMGGPQCPLQRPPLMRPLGGIVPPWVEEQNMTQLRPREASPSQELEAPVVNEPQSPVQDDMVVAKEPEEREISRDREHRRDGKDAEERRDDDRRRDSDERGDGDERRGDGRRRDQSRHREDISDLYPRRNIGNRSRSREDSRGGRYGDRRRDDRKEEVRRDERREEGRRDDRKESGRRDESKRDRSHRSRSRNRSEERKDPKKDEPAKSQEDTKLSNDSTEVTGVEAEQLTPAQAEELYDPLGDANTPTASQQSIPEAEIPAQEQNIPSESVSNEEGSTNIPTDMQGESNEVENASHVPSDILPSEEIPQQVQEEQNAMPEQSKQQAEPEPTVVSALKPAAPEPDVPEPAFSEPEPSAVEDRNIPSQPIEESVADTTQFDPQYATHESTASHADQNVAKSDNVSENGHHAQEANDVDDVIVSKSGNVNTSEGKADEAKKGEGGIYSEDEIKEVAETED